MTAAPFGWLRVAGHRSARRWADNKKANRTRGWETDKPHQAPKSNLDSASKRAFAWPLNVTISQPNLLLLKAIKKDTNILQVALNHRFISFL